jgi:hypothetical protein
MCTFSEEFMPQVLKDLFTSKKFITALIGFGCATVGVAAGVDIEKLIAVVSPFVAFILGQGWADEGKEAAKITNGK